MDSLIKEKNIFFDGEDFEKFWEIWGKILNAPS